MSHRLQSASSSCRSRPLSSRHVRRASTEAIENTRLAIANLTTEKSLNMPSSLSSILEPYKVNSSVSTLEPELSKPIAEPQKPIIKKSILLTKPHLSGRQRLKGSITLGVHKNKNSNDWILKSRPKITFSAFDYPPQTSKRDNSSEDLLDLTSMSDIAKMKACNMSKVRS